MFTSTVGLEMIAAGKPTRQRYALKFNSRSTVRSYFDIPGLESRLAKSKIDVNHFPNFSKWRADASRAHSSLQLHS